MLNKTTIKPTEELQIKLFSASQMGRHYLKQPALFQEKVKLTLMTSHLESMKDCAPERKRQLNEMFKEGTSQESESFVIFGGDFNVRDKEVDEVSLPWRIDDMWEACGRNASTQYTWDTSANDNLQVNWNSKLRFDRIYFRNDFNVSLVPSSFSLVGKERLASGVFPSDHWGIWCEFEHSHKKPSRK